MIPRPTKMNQKRLTLFRANWGCCTSASASSSRGRNFGTPGFSNSLPFSIGDVDLFAAEETGTGL
jgi:hypothetical protein